MMKICCVEDCTVTADEDIRYFEFPTSRLLRKRWLAAINSPKVPPDARICIRHFTRADYELVRGKTRLRGRVVPSRFGGQENNSDSATESVNEDNDHNEVKTNETSTTNNDHGKNEKSPKNNDKINENSSKNDTENHEKSPPAVNDENHKKSPKNDDKSNEKSPKNDKSNEKSPKNNEKSPNNDEGNNGKSKSNEKTSKKRKRRRKKLRRYSTESSEDEEVMPNARSRKNITKKNDCQGGKNDCRSDKNDCRSDKNDCRSDKNDYRSDKNVCRSNKNDCASVKNSSDTGKSNSSNKNVLPEKSSQNERRSLKNGVADTGGSKILERVESSQPDFKEDIEDIITNYHIENKKTERQVAAMTELLPREHWETLQSTDGLQTMGGLQSMDGLQSMAGAVPVDEVDITGENDEPPVFIEMSVGQDHNQETRNDCLMLLESVQCDVDPALLLHARDSDDDTTKNPISLVTSSDDSDVILQEPHIDTVEVSDETSEDDRPLARVASRRTKKKKKLPPRSTFTCVRCDFVSDTADEHKEHIASHNKVLQVCNECHFTTSSRSQMYRHRRQHKNEKKHKCPLCNYKAKHSMSLIYHIKTHSESSTENFSCDNCHFKSHSRDDMDRHMKVCALIICDVDRLNCDLCRYNTKRKSDLKRHKLRVHKVEE